MRTGIQVLRHLTGALALCAGAAGIAGGCLIFMFGGLACLDICPTKEEYFSRFLTGTMNIMWPSLALALLALVVYLAYCLAIRRAWAVIAPALALVAGCAVLDGLAQLARAHLPVVSDGLLAETPLVRWNTEWGAALMILAAAWSALLVWRVWSAEIRILMRSDAA